MLPTIGLVAALALPQLTDADRRAGWRELLGADARALWQERTGTTFPDRGWVLADDVLHQTPGGGDLVSRECFEDFELEFEWKAAAGANSGVKYRVPTGSHVGPEYQILDDFAHRDGGDDRTRAGALYGLYPSTTDKARSGTWHHARIVARGERIEHWLDGVRLFVAHVGSDDWLERQAASKFASVKRYGAGPGHLLLQDHGNEVWYRDLRLRDWNALPGEAVDLLPGPDLEGWRALGDAVYERDGDGILGFVGGGAQSFLVTERTFADFVLEVDVRTEDHGNSGIQVRSHVSPEGRLSGYQIEIDPSARAWSGGLYDEGRRGWLDDLEGDAAARAAFRHGAWNRYRIECVGPRIRAWVNGVPTADFTDDADEADSEGVLGLQVHSGDNTRVRWRGFRLQVL